MNEEQTKRPIDSHSRLLMLLISYFKTGLNEISSMPSTQLMFEKTIREGVKVDALVKLLETSET